MALSLYTPTLLIRHELTIRATTWFPLTTIKPKLLLQIEEILQVGWSKALLNKHLPAAVWWVLAAGREGCYVLQWLWPLCGRRAGKTDASDRKGCHPGLQLPLWQSWGWRGPSGCRHNELCLHATLWESLTGRTKQETVCNQILKAPYKMSSTKNLKC